MVEHFYFLKQIYETRSDVRHRLAPGVRRVRGPSNREGGWSSWGKHTLTEMCAGGLSCMEPFGDTFFLRN